MIQLALHRNLLFSNGFEDIRNLSFSQISIHTGLGENNIYASFNVSKKRLILVIDVRICCYFDGLPQRVLT